MDKNKLLIPGAIIIAALVIGGAIIFATRGRTSSGTSTDQVKQGPPSLAIPAASSTDHIIGGDMNAPYIFVEYSDLSCPYCKIFHPTMHQIISESAPGKAAWVFRQLPLQSLHPDAPYKALASECVAAQIGNSGFWKFIDQIYNKTSLQTGLDAAQIPKIASAVGADPKKVDDCVKNLTYKDTIVGEIADAANAGAHGTPFTILLLKQGMDQKTVNNIKSLNTVLMAQYKSGGQDIVTVSDDGKKILFGGALDYKVMAQIITLASGGYPIK